MTPSSARDPSPEIQAFANSRIGAMLDAHPELEFSQLEEQLRRVLRDNAGKQSKHARLIKIANAAIEAAAPFIACRRGCASCCYVPVHVLATEAARIASATGRRMVRLPIRASAEVARAEQAFHRQPCPFLGPADECSIYEVRPMSCRIHHSLNADGAHCDVHLPEEINIPSYSGLRLLDMALGTLMGEREPKGDIREFFPLESA